MGRRWGKRRLGATSIAFQDVLDSKVTRREARYAAPRPSGGYMSKNPFIYTHDELGVDVPNTAHLLGQPVHLCWRIFFHALRLKQSLNQLARGGRVCLEGLADRAYRQRHKVLATLADKRVRHQ